MLQQSAKALPAWPFLAGSPDQPQLIQLLGLPAWPVAANSSTTVHFDTGLQQMAAWMLQHRQHAKAFYACPVPPYTSETRHEFHTGLCFECVTGLQQMRDVELHGCRNIVNLPGRCLPGLASLTALTSLSLRNCDGLQDGALCSSALTRLLRLDLSGDHLSFV